MPYSADIQEFDDYIRVEVTGKRIAGKEVKDSFEIWSKVAQFCTEKGIVRILAIINLIGPLPISSAYEIAKDPESFGWTRNFKTALVNLNKESVQEIAFMSNVTQNHGFNVIFFNKEQNAIDWLLEE